MIKQAENISFIKNENSSNILGLFNSIKQTHEQISVNGKLLGYAVSKTFDLVGKNGKIIKSKVIVSYEVEKHSANSILVIALVKNSFNYNPRSNIQDLNTLSRLTKNSIAYKRFNISKEPNYPKKALSHTSTINVMREDLKEHGIGSSIFSLSERIKDYCVDEFAQYWEIDELTTVVFDASDNPGNGWTSRFMRKNMPHFTASTEKKGRFTFTRKIYYRKKV